MLKKNIWTKALVVGLLLVLPATTYFAQAQNRKQFDLADRVLFGPKGPRTQSLDIAKPRDTDEYLVHLKPGADIYGLAIAHRLARLSSLHADGWYVLKGRGSERPANVARELARDPNVIGAGVNQETNFQRFGFTPNDPYFYPNKPSIGWDGQWHLINNIGGTIDADVKPAWDNNWTGSGVVIGILDDCLQKAHPDLAPNFSPSNSYNFGNNTPDPSPVYVTDMHGTSVSGVAAARGGNGIGVTGAAPFAKLAGLRVDFNNQSDQEFVDATLFHSSGSNTTIKIENHSYGYTAPFVDSPLETQALATSAAAGTIHCFAAGNERGNRAEDSNTLQLQASPDSITVAAIGEDGTFASYSSFGSNVFVCAPSNSQDLPSITTTDVTGGNGYNPSDDTFPDEDYTSIFGGTSSATPLVSGVLALAKQANPNLTPRLAKHLLARSCRIVDPTDSTASGGWTTNAAGLAFNENYGFGLIDAGKLVTEAQMYQSVTKLQTEVQGPFTDGRTIPDDDPTGISDTFTVNSTTPLEDVEMHIDITHPYRGDLEIWLRSPSGTWSRIKSVALGATVSTSDSGANINWTFSSNAFWGENPAGTWTLLVKDLGAGDIGALNDYTFTAHMGLPVLADNASFITQNVPTSMIAGQTYTVPMTFQNNGFSTWTNPAWYLRSENISANTTWGASVLNLSSSDSIVPGQSKTFSMKVIAPLTGGTYNFQWRMRHSGYISFGDYSTNVPVTVTVAPDAARYISASALPASVTAGSAFTVTITLKNVGTNTWTYGSTYQLKAVTSTTKWGNPTIALVPGDNILPGANKSFTFKAVAPTTPGTYVLQYRMANGSTFFGDLSPGFKINVN